MATAVAQTNPTLITPARLWGGRILMGLPVLMLLMSTFMKLSKAPEFASKWSGEMGFPEGTLLPIGLLELFCTAVFVIPRTRVLGAILLTGYLGGAIVTHVRVSQPFAIPLALGVMLWAGLFLTDDRLKSLVPFRAPR